MVGYAPIGGEKSFELESGLGYRFQSLSLGAENLYLKEVNGEWGNEFSLFLATELTDNWEISLKQVFDTQNSWQSATVLGTVGGFEFERLTFENEFELGYGWTDQAFGAVDLFGFAYALGDYKKIAFALEGETEWSFDLNAIKDAEGVWLAGPQLGGEFWSLAAHYVMDLRPNVSHGVDLVLGLEF